MSLTILVTGPSGFVGKAVASRLTASGHRVLPLRRDTAGSASEAFWNPETGQVQLGGITYRIIRKIDRFFTKERFPKGKVQNISRHLIDVDNLDGDMHFEFKSSAILFKKENEKFHQICRGTSLVNNEMESLIGINFNVIEKTVYIRQKEVDMLALADPGELRDPLKDLFNLTDFDDNIKEHLRYEIGNLNEEIKDLKVKLGNLVTEQNELIQNQYFLTEKKHLSKIKQDEISQLRTNLLRYPSHEHVERIITHIKKLEKLQIDLKIEYSRQNAEEERIQKAVDRIKKYKSQNRAQN